MLASDAMQISEHVCTPGGKKTELRFEKRAPTLVVISVGEQQLQANSITLTALAWLTNSREDSISTRIKATVKDIWRQMDKSKGHTRRK